MKHEWLSHCITLSKKEADIYSGCRKILRTRALTFYKMDSSLQLEHAGYTKSKMSHLTRGYYHEESINAAKFLWERLRQRDKYGSAGFSTYNHLLKVDPDKKSKRASVMGPCVQSVVITYIDRRTYAIDVFYRTTELFKKFPADLVFLRDVLLSGFDFDKMKLEALTCHFANITCHPMYFVTLIPELVDPIADLEVIRKKDQYFYDWIVKWTARYVCPEYHRGIQKFAQAMRVHHDATSRIDRVTMRQLQKYLKDNHPGYRKDYEEPEDDEA